MVSKPCGSVTVHCLSCRFLASNIIITAGADQRLLLLDHDGGEDIVGIDADHIGVAQQVDAVREQETQRRLRQRKKILGRELAVAHGDEPSVGNDVDRIGGSYSKRTRAGLLDVELACGLVPSGPTCTKSPTKVLMLDR